LNILVKQIPYQEPQRDFSGYYIKGIEKSQVMRVKGTVSFRTASVSQMGSASPLPVLDVEDIDRILDLLWWNQNVYQ
jgi:hypothetical protein